MMQLMGWQNTRCVWPKHTRCQKKNTLRFLPDRPFSPFVTGQHEKADYAFSCNSRSNWSSSSLLTFFSFTNALTTLM